MERDNIISRTLFDWSKYSSGRGEHNQEARKLWGENIMMENTFCGKNIMGRTLIEGRTLWRRTLFVRRTLCGEHFLGEEHFGVNTFFLVMQLFLGERRTREPTVVIATRAFCASQNSYGFRAI